MRCISLTIIAHRLLYVNMLILFVITISFIFVRLSVWNFILRNRLVIIHLRSSKVDYYILALF